MRFGMLDGNQVALAENFARTLLLGRYSWAGPGGTLSDSEIRILSDWFHPDVVIEEIAERKLFQARPGATEAQGKQ
jgi:hypothetical protein